MCEAGIFFEKNMGSVFTFFSRLTISKISTLTAHLKIEFYL